MGSVAVLNQNCIKILRNTTKHNIQIDSKLLAPFDFRNLLNWRLDLMSIIASVQFYQSVLWAEWELQMKFIREALLLSREVQEGPPSFLNSFSDRI